MKTKSYIYIFAYTLIEINYRINYRIKQKKNCKVILFIAKNFLMLNAINFTELFMLLIILYIIRCHMVRKNIQEDLGIIHFDIDMWQ